MDANYQPWASFRYGRRRVRRRIQEYMSAYFEVEELVPVLRTALVVGAGIGGLSAAISPGEAAWNVRVFERGASVREIGFALFVARRPERDGRAAGAGRRRGGVAWRSCADAWRGATDGRHHPEACGLSPPEVIGGRTVVALRWAVHGGLLEAVGEDTVALDCEATGVSVAGDRRTLPSTDGTSPRVTCSSARIASTP